MKYVIVIMLVMACAKSSTNPTQANGAILNLDFTDDPPMQQQGQWVTGQIYVRNDNSTYPNVIFHNTASKQGSPSGQWTRVKLTDFGLPTGAKSVFLVGRLIITNGTTVQGCDLTITFRAPGNDLPASNYQLQAASPIANAGVRTPMSTWAPVVNDEIEYEWNRNTFGEWPEECSYGIDLTAQAFLL